MNIQSFVFNHFRENTFVLWDDSNNSVIIDPGCFWEEEVKELLSFIKNNKLTIKRLLLTHGHIDHIFGINILKENFPSASVEIHPDDIFLIRDAIKYAAHFNIKINEIKSADRLLQDGEIIKESELLFEVIHVPGHSPGSVCFYSKENHVVFSGDVIFPYSIGRTDLPGGDQELLINSIKSKILQLPENTVIYCGHGTTTTVGFESVNNPFF